MALWSGRFEKGVSEFTQEFGASLPVDKAMYHQDIAGSRAHARMLAAQGVISEKDAEDIVAGLADIEKTIEEGNFTFDINDEDIHMSVEKVLTQNIGDAGARLHTGRSRNDQVALDVRMYAMAAIRTAQENLRALIRALLSIAKENLYTVMPGYTHLQRAQPITLAHHMMAWVEMLLRDIERLNGAYARADSMPLGSGALAGTTYPLNRARVAELLGFSQLGSESAWRVGSTRSIEEAAERHGVSLMMLNAYQKQEKQIDAIRSFISYRVDVISFAPIVEDGWDTVLTEAKAAGIPVILVDRLITTQDESLYACFVGADFIKEGRSAGEFLLKKADAMGAEHLNIVEITGTEDSTPQRQRHQGFHDAIAGDERFTVLESISGDFLVSKGEECMRYLLDKYGADIDVLYSHNDGMTLGAIDAIREYGLSPGSDIIIITVDGEQAAIDLLKAGEINCVVECTPNLGDSVMELAKKLAAGEDVPRMSHPDEDVFTEFDDLSDLAPRGY